MCSVGFDSQFGMNIKQYQQMNQMRFGTGVRQATYQPQQFSMDTSLFGAGKTNLFAQNSQTHSLNFNGVQYDNSFAMLNSVGNNDKSENNYSLKDNIKSLGKEIFSGAKSIAKTIGSTVKSLAGKIASGAKNLFNKITGGGDGKKSANVDKALGDIQSAQDKETLNQALGNANQEGQSVGKQLQTDNKNLKSVQGQETKAEQGADNAQQGLDKANQGLDKTTQEYDNTKSEVQQAEDGLQTAQGKVATAQQALDTAKVSATEDNPNTAAIKQAEADLASAKQEEEAAQKRLDNAKQNETNAKETVDNSEQQVKTSEQENTEAQKNVTEAKSNTQEAQTQVQTTESQSKEIDNGIKEGEQKMQKMDENSPAENTQKSDETSQTDTQQNANPTIENPSNSLQIKNVNAEMEFAGLTQEERKEVIGIYNQVNNLQPGQSVEIQGHTYTKGSDGVVTRSDKMGGGDMRFDNGLDPAADAAGFATRRKQSEKEDDKEFKLYEQQMKAKKQKKKA